MAWVAAVAPVPSLARELAGAAKKKKKKRMLVILIVLLHLPAKGVALGRRLDPDHQAIIFTH